MMRALVSVVHVPLGLKLSRPTKVAPRSGTWVLTLFTTSLVALSCLKSVRIHFTSGYHIQSVSDISPDVAPTSQHIHCSEELGLGLLFNIDGEDVTLLQDFSSLKPRPNRQKVFGKLDDCGECVYDCKELTMIVYERMSEFISRLDGIYIGLLRSLRVAWVSGLYVIGFEVLIIEECLVQRDDQYRRVLVNM